MAFALYYHRLPMFTSHQRGIHLRIYPTIVKIPGSKTCSKYSFQITVIYPKSYELKCQVNICNRFIMYRTVIVPLCRDIARSRPCNLYRRSYTNGCVVEVLMPMVIFLPPYYWRTLWGFAITRCSMRNMCRLLWWLSLKPFWNCFKFVNDNYSDNMVMNLMI